MQFVYNCGVQIVRHKTKRGHITLVLAMIILVVSLTNANAQEEESTYPYILEEVIVTAQKREQLLQEVPVAVTAVTAQQIADAEIYDIRNLQLFSPSVNVTQAASAYQTLLSIRGIGTSGFNPGLEPSVGVFVDGVYRSRTGTSIGDFNNIERIEILRGPQSVLYGKNSSAGVIGYHTRKPEFEFGSEVKLGLGNYDLKIASARVTGPLIDDVLAFSLTANYHDRDGFILNPTQDITVNDRDRWAVRGQFLWDVTDDVEIRFIADKSKHNELCCAAPIFVNGPTIPLIGLLGGTLTMPPDPFARVVHFDAIMNSFMDDGGLSMQVDWALNDGLTFTSITAYRDFESDSDFDADFTDVDLIHEVGNLTQIDVFTQEFRLTSTGNDKLDWLAGAFFYNQDLHVDGKVRYGNDTRPFFDALTAGAVTQIEMALDFPLGTFFMPGTGMVNEVTDSESQSWAVFGQLDYYITDSLSLTVGLRYTDEDKEGKGVFKVVDPWAALPLDLLLPPPEADQLAATQIFPPIDDYDRTRNESEWSGNLILSWFINDDMNSYISYSRGFKAGGFILGRDSADPDSNAEFDPEFIDNYEIGLKSRFLDNRSQLNIAVFYEDVQDFQTTLFDGVRFNLANAGSIDIYGVELESQTQLTEDLHWLLAVTYLDASYSSYVDAPCPIFDPKPVCDLSGEVKDDAPKWTITTNLTWNKPISNKLVLNVRGEMYYRSSHFTAGDNDPLTWVGGTTLLNASVGISNNDWTWDIRIWGRNLTNEQFPQVMFDTTVQPGSYSGYPNDPRTYGITARFWF